jgi:hypothetical protein
MNLGQPSASPLLQFKRLQLFIIGKYMSHSK